MRCLVTGASGHRGFFLTRYLVKQGAEVFILVRPESDLWRISDILTQVIVLRADLCDSLAIKKSVKLAKAEQVFHLAWYGVNAEARNKKEQILTNVTGTLELLREAVDAGCNCWVGLGSQAEYGSYSGILREETPPHPSTAYGISKYCTGLLSQELCKISGVRFIWLRLLATYGPMEDERHLIPYIIQQLLAGKKPSLTPGEQIWDYLYIEDAAQAIYSAASSNEVDGFFNLGSGKSFSIRTFAELIRDLIDPKLTLGLGDKPYSPNQVMNLQVDISRLVAASKWRPETSIEEGLLSTINWFKTKTI